MKKTLEKWIIRCPSETFSGKRAGVAFNPQEGGAVAVVLDKKVRDTLVHYFRYEDVTLSKEIQES